MTSVLQPWVERLPLRAQGTLLTAVRGCDLTPKLPLHSKERVLVGAIRFAFMVPADDREIDIPGAFFQTQPPLKIRWSEFGHYPWHWLSHIVHAIEVIAYSHPNPLMRRWWITLYYDACHSFHMNPESQIDWEVRMTEDRIAADTVVS